LGKDNFLWGTGELENWGTRELKNWDWKLDEPAAPPFPFYIFPFPLNSYGPAGFGALPAGKRTFPAMVVVVLFAFVDAALAEVGTEAAQVFCVGASEAHQLCCGITGNSTFHVILNTFGHAPRVFFFQAGRSALVADRCAAQAGFDAFLIVVVAHISRLAMQ
jgi:hypothetical protein